MAVVLACIIAWRIEGRRKTHSSKLLAGPLNARIILNTVHGDDDHDVVVIAITHTAADAQTRAPFATRDQHMAPTHRPISNRADRQHDPFDLK